MGNGAVLRQGGDTPQRDTPRGKVGTITPVAESSPSSSEARLSPGPPSTTRTTSGISTSEPVISSSSKKVGMSSQRSARSCGRSGHQGQGDSRCRRSALSAGPPSRDLRMKRRGTAKTLNVRPRCAMIDTCSLRQWTSKDLARPGLVSERRLPSNAADLYPSPQGNARRIDRWGEKSVSNPSGYN
jgi:hypothetical protein